MPSLPIWLKDFRFFQIFILGIISGMPFSILYTGLIGWMADYKIDLAILATFAIARSPYSLKVFWSPLIDYIKIPLLHKLGAKKSWIIVTAFFMSVILFTISITGPSSSITYFRYLAILFGIASATYDLSYDSLRVTLFSDNEQAMGAATGVLGWRLGAYVSGGVTMYFVGGHIEYWPIAFMIMSAIFASASVFALTVREIKIGISAKNSSIKEKFQNLVIEPFRDILTRDNALIILASIICYKMGEAMLGFMSMPFYKELGYNNEQIGLYVKTYGLFATLLGSIIGGIVVYRAGNIKGLIICGILQSLSNLTYLWLHHEPVGAVPLFVAVSVDNFTGGMGTTALVGYLSALCNKTYSASQYALLSSMSGLVNNVFSSYSGSIIKFIGWDNFFVLTVFLEFPALFLLIYIGKKQRL